MAKAGFSSSFVKNGILLDVSAVDKPGSRDFMQLYVNSKKVFLRFWKISNNLHGQYPPDEDECTHEEFEHDDRMRSKMKRFFGDEMVPFVDNLLAGQLNYLCRLEDDLLISIIQYLELEDIWSLAHSSHKFRMLCHSDKLWEKLYRQHTNTEVTGELRLLAEEHGWMKLFFTNKLQLQMQLRRKAQARGPAGDTVFVTQTPRDDDDDDDM